MIIIDERDFRPFSTSAIAHKGNNQRDCQSVVRQASQSRQYSL